MRTSFILRQAKQAKLDAGGEAAVKNATAYGAGVSPNNVNITHVTATAVNYTNDNYYYYYYYYTPPARKLSELAADAEVGNSVAPLGMAEQESEEETQRKLASAILVEYDLTLDVFVIVKIDDYVGTGQQYSSINALYNGLVANLNQSISDQSFNDVLQQVSAALGSNCTGNSYIGGVIFATPNFLDGPSAAPTPAPTGLPHHHNSQKLSAGAIAGIVIGSAIVFLLILACCYFFIFVRSKKVEPIY